MCDHERQWSGSLIIRVTALALMFLYLLIDPQGHPGHRHEPPNVSMKTSTASVSPVSKNVTTTTLKDIGKSSSETKDSPASNHGTSTTSTPFATSKMITPVVSTNMTSTTLRSTPKITYVSQNTYQVSVSTVPTAHNSSSSVTGMYKMDLFFPMLKNSC